MEEQFCGSRVSATYIVPGNALFEASGFAEPQAHQRFVNLFTVSTCDMLPPPTRCVEVGASCSTALTGRVSTGYPRVSRGFYILRIYFTVLFCSLLFFVFGSLHRFLRTFQHSAPLFTDIDDSIDIPVHTVPAYTDIDPLMSCLRYTLYLYLLTNVSSWPTLFKSCIPAFEQEFPVFLWK